MTRVIPGVLAGKSPLQLGHARSGNVGSQSAVGLNGSLESLQQLNHGLLLLPSYPLITIWGMAVFGAYLTIPPSQSHICVWCEIHTTLGKVCNLMELPF